MGMNMLVMEVDVWVEEKVGEFMKQDIVFLLLNSEGNVRFVSVFKQMGYGIVL